MSAMIVLTIGPVQSYISQARRTQDLWQGSRILSYLASAGVYFALHQQAKGLAEVIYPSIEPPLTDNIPNRMVVRWLGDENGAKLCAKEMEKAIRDAWRSLSANTMRYFTKSLEPNELESVLRIWQGQEDTWLECYWIVSPETSALYSENMRNANDAIGARKLLRNFPQIDEGGRKCSITGEHEALHVTGDYVGFWNDRKAEQCNLALLGNHERLSAISVIKRFAHEEAADNSELQFPNRFPSTSSIASAPFRYGVLQALDRHDIDTTKLRQKLKEFIQVLLKLFNKSAYLFFKRDGQYNPEYFGLIGKVISKPTLEDELVQQFRSIDGDFLFEDTLISKTIEEYSGEKPTRQQMSGVQQALSELLKAVDALNISRPQPYFVILSMDGDHMGKTLGGLDKGQHKLFSERLANFARHDVTRIVEEEHLGRVVYAGGDDVLALLPVQDALQVAEKLRSEFEKVVAAIGIKNHKGNPVTASTGLAYVHHTHNLQAAVRAANDAQKIAKNNYGRKALGVEFLRRSGEPRSMGQKWQINDTTLFIQVDALTKAFADGLSRNLPYDLTQIAYSMTDINVPYAARVGELRRILKRRLNEAKKDSIDPLSKSIWQLINEPEEALIHELLEKAKGEREYFVQYLHNLEGKAEGEFILLIHALLRVEDDRVDKYYGKILSLIVEYLRQRWQNAQCWLELARFITQTTEAEGN